MKNYIKAIVLCMCLLFIMPLRIQAANEITVRATGNTATDTTNLNNALNGGNVKIILEGDFKIDYYRLPVYSNTTIDATNATIEQMKAGAGILRNDGGKGGYDSLSNVKVIGGKWIGSLADSDGYSTFFFQHANNIVLENVEFVNNYNGHHLELAGVKDITIKNCIFGGTYKGEDEKEAIQLEICHKDSAPTFTTPLDSTANDGITVTGCTITFPRGVGNHRIVEDCWNKNLTVSNCKFDVKYCAVGAYSIVGLNVNNNTIACKKDTPIDVTTLSKSTDADYIGYNKKTKTSKNYGINISGNNISSSNVYGIMVTGAENRIIEGAVISNNTISSTKKSGVYVRYANGSTISGNTITSTTENGVFLDNSNSCTVQNNTIGSVKTHGVLVSGSTGAKVIGNSISNVAKNNGVTVQTSSTSAKIEGNTIDTINSIGVSVLSSKKVTIKDNKISDCKKQGIIINKKSESAKIMNNEVNNSGTNAITIQDKSNKATVSGNTINKSKKNGISMIDSANIKITKNNISNCKDMGISTKNGKATITENVITTANNKKKYGIYIQNGKSCVIKKNEVIGECYRAIGIDSKSSGSIKRLECINVNNIKKGKKSVKGTVGNSSYKVSAKIDNKKYKVSKSGTKWSISKCPKLKSGMVVVVSATDKQKNVHSMEIKVK